ncbi:putative nucleotidyltransferase [Caldalkalibacillus uzonensis]|uniref:tRNA(Met) cytidine acetate ligase n=1 Tax=Caldalkalibacillus uzonensis TaxID=353224 RepID=A0ABU0CTJ2_9BACI|nr:nucleotidyltransferase [Caldalkalibacillus uzonensis]MDQ0339199.1 putative nucleotidyltransferase [Caldalkalibacillus uzonensis]
MKVVGLIVEYNPLHNGHRYHFEQAMALTGAEACVIVMSGHFLQRGEPALVNKWARTRMALDMGVDLVFELPYVYSTQQAEIFAYGAVFLLNQLPFVTHLCFGSESGNLEELNTAARMLATESQSFKKTLKAKLKEGHPYAYAYGHALAAQLNKSDRVDAKTFAQPNNILGLHYLMALHQLKSTIQPVTIKRYKAHYHQQTLTDTHIASATSIRQALLETAVPDWEAIRPFVPSFTLDVLKEEYEAGRGLICWENFYSYLLYALLSHSARDLNRIYEMEEGIEHRLKACVLSSHSAKHLIEQVKTKRYTWNRIQRILVHTLTQCHKQDIENLSLQEGPAYLRLLGYSAKGRELLNRYKKELTIPLIANIRQAHPPMLDWDLKAARIYTLGYRSDIRAKEWKRELAQPPLRT